MGLIASVWFRCKFWKLITLKSTVLAVTSKNPIRAWTVSSMARNIIWKTFIYFKHFACGEISMFTDRLTPQPGLLFCSNNWSLYYIYFKRFAYGEISRFTDRLWMIAMSTAPISQRSWLQIPHRPFFFFFFSRPYFHYSLVLQRSLSYSPQWTFQTYPFILVGSRFCEFDCWGSFVNQLLRQHIKISRKLVRSRASCEIDCFSLVER